MKIIEETQKIIIIPLSEFPDYQAPYPWEHFESYVQRVYPGLKISNFEIDGDRVIAILGGQTLETHIVDCLVKTQRQHMRVMAGV